MPRRPSLGAPWAIRAPRQGILKAPRAVRAPRRGVLKAPRAVQAPPGPSGLPAGPSRALPRHVNVPSHAAGDHEERPVELRILNEEIRGPRQTAAGAGKAEQSPTQDGRQCHPAAGPNGSRRYFGSSSSSRGGGFKAVEVFAGSAHLRRLLPLMPWRSLSGGTYR